MSKNPDDKLIITDHPDIESARRAQERKAFLEAEEERERQQKSKKNEDAPKSNIIITDDPAIESARRAQARKRAREEEEERERQLARINADRYAGTDPRTGRPRIEPTWDDLKFAALTQSQEQANDNLRSILNKPANDVLAMASAPPAAGQPVLGHAVANLGNGASESRLKAVAKTVGGMALPVAGTLAAKAAFAMAATAAFPAYAPLVVPVVFAAWAVISLTKSARAIMHDLNETSAAIQERDKVGKARAFRMALNQNKFKTGMLIGSAVMLTLGLNGTLDNLAEPAAKFLTDTGLGEKLSAFMGAGPAQAAGLPAMAPLSPEAVSSLQVEAPAAAPVAITAEPMAELAKVPQDQFRELIANQNVSDDVKQAAERMLSTDPKIAAQATKDAAFHLLNGIGMDGGNDKLAVALLKEAADAGNVQARVDLAYLQYHGLAGVDAAPKEALAAMQDIKTDARAVNFVAAWTGHMAEASPVVAAPAGSTSTFIQVPEIQVSEPKLPEIDVQEAPLSESQFVRQPTPQEILQAKMEAALQRTFSTDPSTAHAGAAEWAELNKQMEALNKGEATTVTVQADAKPTTPATAVAKADVPSGTADAPAAPSTPTDTRTTAQAARDALDKAKTVQTAATDMARIKDGIDILRRR